MTKSRVEFTVFSDRVWDCPPILSRLDSEMSERLRFSIGAVFLASVLCLLWSLPAPGADPVGLIGLTDKALEEKQRLLDGIAEGQVIYLRKEQYTRSRPQNVSPEPDSVWTLPQHILVESWIAADENGQIATYSTTGRSIEGELLIYSTIENGRTVFRNLATGKQESIPASREIKLESWLEGMWSSRRRLLGRGFEFVGTGWLNGMRTAILEEELERTTSSNRPADQRERMQIPSYQWYTTRTTAQRLEFPLDKPILFRMTQWEMDEAGKRTLTHDFRTLEYKLLPADTQIGPFDR